MKNNHIQDKLWHLAFRKTYDSEFFIPVVRGEKIDLRRVFSGHYNKISLEMGSGWGEVAVQMALREPDTAYVLLEKKMKRISYTLKKIRKNGIANIRIIPADFTHFFGEMFAPDQFDEIILNFPDPWPKKKHWKNRTVTPEFLHTIYALLKQGGIFHFATDYGPYARKVIRLLRKDARFAFTDEYSLTRDFIPISRFESEKKDTVPRLYYISRRKV